MKRVGTVVRAANHLAVVRSPDETHPDTGARLLADDLEPAGTVVDVFGPVERPYVAVSPAQGVRLADLVGRPLYEE